MTKFERQTEPHDQFIVPFGITLSFDIRILH